MFMLMGHSEYETKVLALNEEKRPLEQIRDKLNHKAQVKTKSGSNFAPFWIEEYDTRIDPYKLGQYLISNM